MSGCLSLCPYKMNNIVHEAHSSNSKFSREDISSLNSKSFGIKRSLSADMSNQKWLKNNGFPVKRVQSSEKLQALEEDEFEKKVDDDSDDQVNDGGNKGGAAFEDIWSSILSQKKVDGSGQVPAPYVHPLVKRSTSLLSEKSLEICTESLGSETGSDGLFSYPASGYENEEKEVELTRVAEQHHCHDHVVVVVDEVAKYNYPVNKKVGPPKSFPPPLPSLANRDDGLNLHMRTSRLDGRLVLEAVSVPSQNCFRAQRQDGRLLLTLTNELEVDDEIIDEDEVFEDDEEDVETTGNGGKLEKLTIVMDETANRIINVRNSSSEMIMSKLMELTRSKNQSTWPRYYNTPVIKSLEEDAEEDVKESVKVEKRHKSSLPPQPKLSTATTAVSTLNAYEYYWRRSDSPTAAAVAVLKPIAGNQNSSASPQLVRDSNRNKTFLLTHNGKAGAAEEVVLVKAAAVEGAAGEKREYLVPIFRGCKEPRRSLLLLDPYCIATS